jgi:hypothetical protein
VSSRTRGRRGRRLGGALILTGLLCGTGAIAALQASSAGAAELFSFDLKAGARGFNYYSTSAKDAGLDDPGATVGETEALLQSGPVGYGLATVAWPGPIAANGGTLLLVLQPGAPPQAANAANYPVRAESRTGQDPPKSTYTNVPGTTLESSATATDVSADAKIAGAAGVPGTFGTTTAHSGVKSTADGALAEASSLVQDINIGGVIKIGSVKSTAAAKTDGIAGTGDAATVVNDMTVGGQPAYVDQDGLKIGTQGQPANAVANQIAQQALGSAGFKIYVSTPQKEIKGSSATVTAGSLIISHEPPGGGIGTIVFGGSTAQVAGAPGDANLLSDLTGGAGGTGGSALGSTGTGSVGDVGGVTPSAPVTGSGAKPGAVSLGAPKNASSKGTPVRPGTVVLGTLAAVFLAAGMRRLSDDVLAERVAATTCSLEEGG